MAKRARRAPATTRPAAGPSPAAQVTAREQEVINARSSRQSAHTDRQYTVPQALHTGVNHDLQTDFTLQFLLETLSNSYDLDNIDDRQAVDDIYNYATANVRGGSTRRTFYQLRDRWANRERGGRQHRHWPIIRSAQLSAANEAIRDDAFRRVLNAAQVLGISLDLTNLPVALRHLVPNAQQAAAPHAPAAPQAVASNVPAAPQVVAPNVAAQAHASTRAAPAPPQASTRTAPAPSHATASSIPARSTAGNITATQPRPTNSAPVQGTATTARPHRHNQPARQALTGRASTIARPNRPATTSRAVIDSSSDDSDTNDSETDYEAEDEDDGEYKLSDDDGSDDEDGPPIRRSGPQRTGRQQRTQLPHRETSPGESDVDQQAPTPTSSNAQDSDADDSEENRSPSEDESENLHGVSNNKALQDPYDDRHLDFDVVMQSDYEGLPQHNGENPQNGSDDDESLVELGAAVEEFDEDVDMNVRLGDDEEVGDQYDEDEVVEQTGQAFQDQHVVAGSTAAYPTVMGHSLYSLNIGNPSADDNMAEWNEATLSPLVLLNHPWASRPPHDYGQVLADLGLGPNVSVQGHPLQPLPQADTVLDSDPLHPDYQIPPAQEPSPFVHPGFDPFWGHDMGVIRDASPQLGEAMDYLNKFLQGDDEFDPSPDTTPEMEQSEFGQGGPKRKHGPSGDDGRANKRARRA